MTPEERAWNERAAAAANTVRQAKAYLHEYRGSTNDPAYQLRWRAYQEAIDAADTISPSIVEQLDREEQEAVLAEADAAAEAIEHCTVDRCFAKTKDDGQPRPLCVYCIGY